MKELIMSLKARDYWVLFCAVIVGYGAYQETGPVVGLTIGSLFAAVYMLSRLFEQLSSAILEFLRAVGEE